jgi:acyl carrier protein
MNKIQENDLSSELIKHMRNNILDPSVAVYPDTPLKDLGFDSVAIIDLILFIERKFGVSIPDTDLVPENLESVSTLAKCTMKYL